MCVYLYSVVYNRHCSSADTLHVAVVRVLSVRLRTAGDLSGTKQLLVRRCGIAVQGLFGFENKFRHPVIHSIVSA